MAKNPEYMKAYLREWKKKNWMYVAALHARNGAVRRSKAVCTLTAEQTRALVDRSQGKCELTGIPFEKTTNPGVCHAKSLSIDRVDPALGYVFENVRLVLYCVNAFKGSGTDEEMFEIARLLLRN